VLIQCVCQQYCQLDQAQEINEALSNYWRQEVKNVQKLELEACVWNEFLFRDFGESGTAVDYVLSVFVVMVALRTPRHGWWGGYHVRH
jgi:hypothetical protein